MKNCKGELFSDISKTGANLDLPFTLNDKKKKTPCYAEKSYNKNKTKQKIYFKVAYKVTY